MSKPVRLNAYPAETSIAEKFHAMVDLDMQNSRMKDFYDIWVLSRTIDFSGNELSEAIRLTFERRKTPLPQEVPTGFAKATSTSVSGRRLLVVLAKTTLLLTSRKSYRIWLDSSFHRSSPPLPRRSTTHIGRRSWGLGKVRRSECCTCQSMSDDHAVLLA
jgi:hypothetical protein